MKGLKRKTEEEDERRGGEGGEKGKKNERKQSLFPFVIIHVVVCFVVISLTLETKPVSLACLTADATAFRARSSCFPTLARGQR